MVRRPGDKTTKGKTFHVDFINAKVEAEVEALKDSDYGLYHRIDNAKKKLENPFPGPSARGKKHKVKDYRMKKKYKRFWKYPNLYKYDLDASRRLIYFIDETEVKIAGMIIEWGDHKKYEDLIIIIPTMPKFYYFSFTLFIFCFHSNHLFIKL